MIRVLHVFEYFAQGGIENFVMNVYRNIDKSLYSFDFAFINKTKGCFDEEAQSMGAHIYYFDSSKKSFRNYKKSISSIIKKNGPFDVVHSHVYFFSGFILKQAYKCGVPIRIAHSHETSKGRKRTITRRIYEFLMRKMIISYSTTLLACSKKAGIHLFGEKTKFDVVYNGIDVSRFRYNETVRNVLREKFNLVHKKVVLHIGRFADQKNHAFIIETFTELIKKDNDYFLILIGDGELEQQIKYMAYQKGVSKNILFLSNIQNVEDYYSLSDVFILPSKYEGLGIVAIEAQVNGLPCLLSDHVPAEARISETTFFIQLDINEWVEAIERSLKITTDRYEINRLFLDTDFDIKHTVDLLTRSYSLDNGNSKKKNC